ncbi:hypothetical protein I4U23_003411 [Adineta vaga]|nr:hypothetical protein I4U23_003411 [Adineta vaga]
MQKLLLLLFIPSSIVCLFYGTTDLPDGDAEMLCATQAGFDIGRDLSDELKSDYSRIPKGLWYRIRGQIRRISYDASESILRHDDPQRQGNCYFQVESNMETEYIQSIPFPRASSMSAPYNYYFSALMNDNNNGIHISLEWYDDENKLMNSTSIHSIDTMNTSNVSRLNEAKLGKIVPDAKTMLIRIITDSSLSTSENTSYFIDMINVVFFPDHIFNSGRP